MEQNMPTPQSTPGAAVRKSYRHIAVDSFGVSARHHRYHGECP